MGEFARGAPEGCHAQVSTGLQANPHHRRRTVCTTPCRDLLGTDRPTRCSERDRVVFPTRVEQLDGCWRQPPTAVLFRAAWPAGSAHCRRCTARRPSRRQVKQGKDLQRPEEAPLRGWLAIRGPSLACWHPTTVMTVAQRPRSRDPACLPTHTAIHAKMGIKLAGVYPVTSTCCSANCRPCCGATAFTRARIATYFVCMHPKWSFASRDWAKTKSPSPIGFPSARIATKRVYRYHRHDRLCAVVRADTDKISPPG